MIAYIATGVHDGLTLHPSAALVVRDGRVESIRPIADLPPDIQRRDMGQGVICPGFVDLQANGGGGVMFNDQTDAAGLIRIAAAHAGTGTGWLLPTLITDTPLRTRTAIAAAQEVIARGDTCVAGLHLEGPHLSHARRGAHDPALIRQMMPEDLEVLCTAARQLPALLVTLAPESATPEQIATLARAGVTVSLGHTDADYQTCRAAFAAGASMVTHLFNAMSQLGHRAPGLVGAALDTPDIAMGLIADGIHVHPAPIRIAQAARPKGLFLVTDAMATLGSSITEFTLNNRVIQRAQGRLTLQDGTLAGADLDLPTAIRFMHDHAATPIETAIAMATGRPGGHTAGVGAGRLMAGQKARAVHIAQVDGHATVLDHS